MASEKITAQRLLFPVFLLSFAFALLLVFQLTLLVSERDNLHTAFGEQDAPLQKLQEIKTQVNALAIGTLHLSQQGNKDAENIMAQLKKAGIDVSDKAPAPTGTATPTVGKAPAAP
jgi:hypothetical protein